MKSTLLNNGKKAKFGASKSELSSKGKVKVLDQTKTISIGKLVTAEMALFSAVESAASYFHKKTIGKGK